MVNPVLERRCETTPYHPVPGPRDVTTDPVLEQREMPRPHDPAPGRGKHWQEQLIDDASDNESEKHNVRISIQHVAYDRHWVLILKMKMSIKLRTLH